MTMTMMTVQDKPAFQGNYHGYYTKRPFLRDPRLARLPSDFFADKTVLDVGCNQGSVTCQVAHVWGAHRVVGVDVDDTLVRAAWKHRRTLWSLQSPPSADTNADTNDTDYFPLSCPQTHGPLPIPIPSPHRPTQFPHNVTFHTADWITEDTSRDAPIYDVVLAFSITKWIHLYHGDQGITTLFQRAHRVLKPSGTLVLEPQAWDTYAKARRMDPRLRENAKHLALRPDDFPRVLQEIGFGPPTRLGTVGEGGFHRPVDLYVKQDKN